MSIRIFKWPADGRPPRRLPAVYAGVMLDRFSDRFTHMGLLYSSPQGPQVLHLSEHRLLERETPWPGRLAIICDIDDFRLQTLFTYARLCYQKNHTRSHGIPYGFSSPDQDWFAPDGSIQLEGERIGLTCSNFVLALFRAAALPLVKLETWPLRDEDIEWQQDTLVDWANGIADSSHRTRVHFNERVRTQIGMTVRCRPTEVGGAALSEQHQLPCDFDTASILARFVERHLSSAAENA
jgi:hypothetical protein